MVCQAGGGHNRRQPFPMDKLYPDYEPDESKEESGNSTKTALLPKSIAKDLNPGDTIKFKVSKVYDDEYEVEPVEEEKENSETEDETQGMDLSANEELDQMASTQE